MGYVMLLPVAFPTATIGGPATQMTNLLPTAPNRLPCERESESSWGGLPAALRFP